MDNKTDFNIEPPVESEKNNDGIDTCGESFEFDIPDVPIMTDDVTGEVFTPAPRKEDSTEGEAKKKPRGRRRKNAPDSSFDRADAPTDTDPNATEVNEKPKRRRKKKSDKDVTEANIEGSTDGAFEAAVLKSIEQSLENSPEGNTAPHPDNNPEILSDNDDKKDSEALNNALTDTADEDDVTEFPNTDTEGEINESADSDTEEEINESADSEGNIIEEASPDTLEDGEYTPAEVIIEELSLFDAPRVVDVIPEAMPDSPLEEFSPSIAPEFIPTKEEKYNPEKPRRVDLLFDFIELFVFTLVAVLLATIFFFRHSIVEGESMLSTLYEGDTLIISGLFYTPERNDIVVVEDYTTSLTKPIVKRVIGIGGDHIKVRKEGIYLNGVLLDEPYVYTDFPGFIYNVYPSDNLKLSMQDNESFNYEFGQYYEFVVPEGELFVLGDHRNNSTDSREIGTVRCDAVLGKVLFRVYPFDSFGQID